MSEKPGIRNLIILLTDLIRRINMGQTFEEVFNLIWENLRDLLPYNRIGVATTTDNETLTMIAVRSDGPTLLNAGYSSKIKGSAIELLLQEGSSRIINDIQDYPKNKPDSEWTRLIVQEGMRSSLIVPLLIEGKLLGVVFFSSRKPNAYNSEHEAILKLIAGHIAIAIEKTRLIQQLKDKSEYLENVLQNSADAIIVVDDKNRIQTWNEGARRIFGYEPHEVIGLDTNILVPPELRKTHELIMIEQRIKNEGFIKDYETTRVTKDGRQIFVSITSTAVFDKTGNYIGRSSIVHDITDVKKLHDELVKQESLAAVGELAASIAHEIKNPLAGISAAMQVISSGIPFNDPKHEIVSEILSQIKRLDDTVKDLLLFARPFQPSMQHTDICELIKKSWTLLSHEPQARNIIFSGPDDEHMLLNLDPQLIQQVLINIFQNAIQASPNDGKITVRLTKSLTRAQISITDTGTGIAPEHKEKLFRPFFSTKARGTGLGLAISRKIIDAHKGKISIESPPEDEQKNGTRVLIELPL